MEWYRRRVVECGGLNRDGGMDEGGGVAEVWKMN
jgi:hypothetical protein